MSLRTLFNISERRFLGTLLRSFYKPPYMSTIEWAKTYRMISNKETSFGAGYFDADRTPYMEYVYDCLDNPYVPIIVAMKSARVTWTETLNNYRGKRIHLEPTSMLLGFSTEKAAKTFAKKKWKYFLEGVEVLRGIIDQGIAENKKNIYSYFFPNGDLQLATLGSIASQKSDNYEYIEIEEPDDAPEDVQGQGDTFANLKERQKLVPTTRKKFIFGGTPTDKDFSRVEKALKTSNHLVFKAECHECHSLIALDHTGFSHIKYDEYPEKAIDDVYGKYNPDSAMFFCPICSTRWTSEQKNLNIIAGKKHGFIDHTGKFSKGWHPLRPNITEVFGFSFSELLFPEKEKDHFVELAKAEILALKDMEIGNELLLKSFTNNKKGQPYASGFSAIEAEEMVLFRKNYPENICPAEALVVVMGIDVQDNRFAIRKRGWGRNGNSWGIVWKEIFGNVLNRSDPVWEDLKAEILKEIPHAGSEDKTITPIYVSIDAADNTELVYDFVNEMDELYSHVKVLACKGVRDLKFSADEIYREPNTLDLNTDQKARKTLAETMGVVVYNVGAHKAHSEILRRLNLVRLAKDRPDEYKSDLFFWNESEYGLYEEQMTSCRKIFTQDRNGNMKEVYKLIPGKRKEAMDCEKLALHAAYAAGIRNYTDSRWRELENYYYRG